MAMFLSPPMVANTVSTANAGCAIPPKSRAQSALAARDTMSKRTEFAIRRRPRSRTEGTAPGLAGQDDARPPPAHFEHQLIDALDEGCRIVELAAFGKQRLVEQHRCPVVELLLLVDETQHHRMLRIDLQDWLRARRRLARRLEESREIGADVV